MKNRYKIFLIIVIVTTIAIPAVVMMRFWSIKQGIEQTMTLKAGELDKALNTEKIIVGNCIEFSRKLKDPDYVLEAGAVEKDHTKDTQIITESITYLAGTVQRLQRFNTALLGCIALQSVGMLVLAGFLVVSKRNKKPTK